MSETADPRFYASIQTEPGLDLGFPTRPSIFGILGEVLPFQALLFSHLQDGDGNITRRFGGDAAGAVLRIPGTESAGQAGAVSVGESAPPALLQCPGRWGLAPAAL